MSIPAPFGTATELAHAVRNRQVSAVEAFEAHMRRIEALNPLVNAIVTLDTDRARQRAEQADVALARGDACGPLHGVPVSVKDSFETAGLRTTAGFLPLANYVPVRDATVVGRLRAAGAILLGKTNVPPLTIGWHTENAIFGRTNNPWHLGHTPGGSSGGSAAALAAGFVALEVGSDLRGSIRVPAHFCGVYGLRPTEGFIPATGHIPELPGEPRAIRHMGVVGPLSRCVEDLGLALRVLAGPDGYAWDVPPVAVQSQPTVDLRKLRVAWTDSFAEIPVTRETRLALGRVAQALATAGARVEQRFPNDLDLVRAWQTWGEIYQSEVGSRLQPGVESKLAHASGAGPDAMAGEERGRARAIGATMRGFAAALNRRDELIGALERFFTDWDVFLCPVSPTTAYAHNSIAAPVAVDEQFVDYSIAGGAYCTPFSVTGQPVVVVPIARASNGLPIGMQLVGARWSDTRLLAIAAAIVSALPSGP
jgi:amidase